MAEAATFDFVIVGAGSAGCVLAERLSESGATVALLEAGPPDDSFKIRIPAAVAAAIGDPRFGWGYMSTPQAHLGGRRIPIPRGRVVGGSGSINGMVYFRGHPGDFDDWADMGADGWSYREVLPYFLKSERNEAYPGSPYHGRSGEMNVIDIPRPNPLVARFLGATEDMQFRRCADFNGPDPEGFGARQGAIRAGRRESSATAFLDRARGRPNLLVVTGALVRQLVMETGRVTAVEYERDGEIMRAGVRREAILAGGSYGSPQILMLSGIGDPQALGALGIASSVASSNVGQRLHDHPAAAIGMKTEDATSYGLSLKAFPRGVWNVLEYATARRGPLASNVFEAHGFVKSRPDLARPDLQVVFMPAHRNANGFPIPLGHGYGIIAINAKPLSRGSVTLASSDPHVAPNIDPNFYAEPADLDVVLNGLKLGRQILASARFADLKATEIVPGAEVRSPEELADHIRKTTVTVHHPAATCAMGREVDAVVDPQLRVRGVANLRVADGSVFPRAVAGNSNAAVVMVAERAADFILGRPQLAPIDLPHAA